MSNVSCLMTNVSLTPMPTSHAIKNRDFVALARLISGIENEDEQALQNADELSLEPKYSRVLGITGLPGAGKSTLVNQLIKLMVKEDKTVAVLAIDPTSPFTGGAVLGDRIRFLNTDETDGKVFFRSMASRGHHGGLSNSTADILQVFNAAQFDYVIIETVGAGQLEVDIAYLTDTLVNVLTPEAGDDIQAIKAGIMEIGDIFVINKSDLPGADRKLSQLQSMLDDVKPKSSREKTWEIPVLKTQAEQGCGIDELLKRIKEHATTTRTDRDTTRIGQHLKDLLEQGFQLKALNILGPSWVDEQAKKIQAHLLTPRQAIQQAFDLIFSQPKDQP